MFDFLFNPLARAQRRLKKVEKSILQEEAILSSRGKIKAIIVYNKYIRKALEKVQQLIASKAKTYQEASRRLQESIGYNVCVQNYNVCLQISMRLDETFNILSKVEKEIAGERAALEELGDSKFTNDWLKDLTLEYRHMFFNVQLLERDIETLAMKKKKYPKPFPRNPADQCVQDRFFPTRVADIERIADRCGYKIVDGSKHKLVLYRGHQIAVIPRHRVIDEGTAESIMKAMAKGA